MRCSISLGRCAPWSEPAGRAHGVSGAGAARATGSTCTTPRSPSRLSAERVVAFYNQRGTAEQWIKEGKNAIKWTRLSCCSFAANAVRLQLHALAYNLANFMGTLALPEAGTSGR